MKNNRGPLVAALKALPLIWHLLPTANNSPPFI